MDYLKFSELKENIAAYLEAKTELIKIQFQEKIEDGFAQLAYNLIKIVLVISLLMAVLLLIGGLLNHFFTSEWLGFAFVFCIIGLILGIWVFFDDYFFQLIRRYIQRSNDKKI